MTLGEFKKSSWFREGGQPGVEGRIASQLPRWKEKVKHLGLAQKTQQLWNYFSSGKASGSDKALVLGALVYIISPFDLIPDAIPVIGWLDDLGLATFVLHYLDRKVSGQDGTTAEDDWTAIEIQPADIETVESIGHQQDGTSLRYRFSELRDAADQLGTADLAGAILDLEIDLDAPLQQVLFAGRIKAGKSSLLNALLGRTCVPVGPVPTTRALTYIVGGQASALISQDAAGEVTRHASPDELLDRDNLVLKKARAVLLTLPSEVLKGGVALIDSPGLDDPEIDFSRLTIEVAPLATAIVLVLDATALLSASEIEFVRGLLSGDRGRKLLVVINKADRVSPAEIEELRREAEKELRNLGAEGRVFALSATRACNAMLKDPQGAMPAEFSEFQTALVEFLHVNITHEHRKYIEGRLGGIEESLRLLCQARLDHLAKGKEARQKEVEQATQSRQAMHEETCRRTHKLSEEVLPRVERRCIANFRVFFSDLRVEVSRKIAAMGLDEIQQTEALASFIRDRTRTWVDNELQAVHAELGKEVSLALYDLQTNLQKISLKALPTTGVPRIAPELVSPALLILSFPLLGMFSWIYLAVGVAFGRNAIEKLSGGLMDAVGLNRFRAALLEKLAPELDRYEEAVATQLGEHFKALQAIILTKVETITKQSSAPMDAILTSSGEGASEERYRSWLKELSSPHTLCLTDSPL